MTHAPLYIFFVNDYYIRKQKNRTRYLKKLQYFELCNWLIFCILILDDGVVKNRIFGGNYGTFNRDWKYSR